VLVTDRTLRGLMDDGRSYAENDKDLPAKALRKATRTGRPAGDPSLIEGIERLTGHTLCRKKPGRREKDS